MALSLLLLVHGRQGGEIPAAIQELAAELNQRRGAPVALQALTGSPPPPRLLRHRGRAGVLLVPLLLLPARHVRHDLPALAAQWRLRRLPFLGAWPAWQRALARELRELAGNPPSGDDRGGGGAPPPLLLHHPVAEPLACRYLRLLERCCGCRCLAAPYSAAGTDAPALPPLPAASGAVLPLALAANRLCERLQAPPLLERPALRLALLLALERLP